MFTVITGPPCSGKSTYVAEHRDAGDVVIDLDVLAQALGYPATHVTWGDEHAAVAAARSCRMALIESMPDRVANHWLIDADPHPTSRRIWTRQGARFVALNPGREACHDRAVSAGRDASVHNRIDAWFARHPDAEVAPAASIGHASSVFD